MIKSIKATNFLSWKELTFDIKRGVTLISGFNYDDSRAEGSGKSAIFNALCYGLFGRMPKDSTVDSVIKEGESSCSVDIEFKDGTHIVRTRKPNDLYIQRPQPTYKIGAVTVEGDVLLLPGRGKDIRDTQKMIENMLGFSFNTFITVMYFAQNNFNSFIYMSEEDKAKVLSELQDLSQFDKARKQATEQLKQLKQNIELSTRDYITATNQFNSYKDQLEKYQLAIDNFEINKQKKFEELTFKITSIKEELAPHKSEKELAEELSILKQENEHIKQEQILEQKQFLIKSNLLVTQKRYEQELNVTIATHSKLVDGGACPTCGGQLSHSNENVYNTTVQTLVSRIIELKQELSSINDQLQNLHKVSQNDALSNLYNSNKHAIMMLEKQVMNSKLLLKDLDSYNNSLKEVEASNCNNFIQEKANLLDKCTALQENQQVYQKNIQDYNEYYKCLEVVKDGFKEVKQLTYIGFLNEINRLVNKYAAELFEVPVFIRFTNLGEEGELGKVYTEITINGIARSLGLLSGGQAKRLELAVFLSLNEIINTRLGNTLNIRILDEVMTNLSLESSKKVISLLKSLQGSTLVIEHNEFIKSIVDSTFNIEYKNGTSVRI